jgi:glycosyltransferase involved in cell wall biosynthesis
MLKILYISPENTVGTLSIWQKAHQEAGNYCRYVTWFRTSGGYPEDICLDLPLIAAQPWYLKPRLWFARRFESSDPYLQKAGYPPRWNPPRWQRAFWNLREKLWEPIILKAIRDYALEDFDVYHFEWGTDFFRDARFARRLKARGKKIICHYHGQDMRNRGVIPAMEALSDLNLTNELDLTFLHPRIKYLFLPYDVQAFQPKGAPGHPLTICHATTNRRIKGSDEIISVCEELQHSHGIRFIFIENQPHEQVLRLKQQADIYIDQITDHAWGYGMNSLEALALGLVCVTYLNPTYEQFIPDHPFVNAHQTNLKVKLLDLINNPQQLPSQMRASRTWVEKYHDYHNVVHQLYQYYHTIGVRV